MDQLVVERPRLVEGEEVRKLMDTGNFCREWPQQRLASGKLKVAHYLAEAGKCPILPLKASIRSASTKRKKSNGSKSEKRRATSVKGQKRAWQAQWAQHPLGRTE